MRDKHTQHRQPLQAVVENVLPLFTRTGLVEATVHNRPTLTAFVNISEQPQVDVV